MERTIRFRLNETLHEIEPEREMLALDWIRNVAGLKGTKEGCREGDCGACLILIGAPPADGRNDPAEPEWYSATSCTMALSDLDGRHIITIEGLASAGLTPVMRALLDEGGSQCGFCSPGFVLALTGALVGGGTIDPVRLVTSIEGNLCRCTGYGSIRRAARRLAREFADLPAALDARLALLSARGVLPAGLASLMAVLPQSCSGPALSHPGSLPLGGGTDYFVRNPDPDAELRLQLVARQPECRHITCLQTAAGPVLELGGAVSVTEFFASPLVRELAPGIEVYADEIASPPIRNRATLAGNIANASPIADMTAMLLALDASLLITGQPRPEIPEPARSREVALCDFFIAYKKIDLRDGEFISAIRLPFVPVRFSFCKVARRARLDIATANSALAVRLGSDGSCTWAKVSAGGIAAVPLRLREVEAALLGSVPGADLARRLGRLAAQAGTPMDDVRGSRRYRRTLMERFMWSHAIRLWPSLALEEELFA